MVNRSRRLEAGRCASVSTKQVGADTELIDTIVTKNGKGEGGMRELGQVVNVAIQLKNIAINRGECDLGRECSTHQYQEECTMRGRHVETGGLRWTEAAGERASEEGQVTRKSTTCLRGRSPLPPAITCNHHEIESYSWLVSIGTSNESQSRVSATPEPCEGSGLETSTERSPSSSNATSLGFTGYQIHVVCYYIP